MTGGLNKYINLMIAGLLLFGASCNQDDSGSRNSGYSFNYYPSLNVYYDQQQNTFLFTTDGGQSWQRKPGTPQIAETLDEKVVINYPLPDVQQENELHRKQYNGAWTDYSSQTSNNTAGELDGLVEPEEKKPKADKDDRMEEGKQEEKKREGLKKVKDRFRKIFKGNN